MGQLLPKAILKSLPRFADVLSIKKNNRIVRLHFYNPIGHGDWFVMAGKQQGDDYIFYGIVYFHTAREDYFSLKELQQKKLPFGAKIIRDRHFEQISLAELLSALKRY